MVAILPILRYIGMLIGSQAFSESPHRHAPAVVLALIPQIAEWGKTMIDNALGAAGTNVEAVGLAKLAQVGVLYNGLETLGAGATLAGIILGAVTVFIIDRALDKAAYFAAAGAVLTFFGFIHGPGIGIGRSPDVAIGYLGVAAILFACHKYAVIAPVSHADEVRPARAPPASPSTPPAPPSRPTVPQTPRGGEHVRP